MNFELGDAISGLFTVSGVLAFFAGMLATRLYYHLKCRYMDKHHPEEGRHHYEFRGLTVLWALIFILAAFLGFQQQTTAAKVRHLSEDTRKCQLEFLSVLKERGAIQEDNDKWSIIQRTALGEWLHELLLPPPDINELRAKDPNNPRVQQWGLDVTAKYDKIIQQAQREQEENQAERAQHKFPETKNCGI